MRFADNFDVEGLLVIAGERLECPQLEDLPGSSGKTRQSINSFIVDN